MLVKFGTNFKRKELIAALVKIYKKQNKEEYESVVRAVKELRQTRANKFAADEDYQQDTTAESLRFILRIPKTLDEMVNQFLHLDQEPRFLMEQEEVQWFAKAYSEFRVAEKI